jgi:hypothetical protein
MVAEISLSGSLPRGRRCGVLLRRIPKVGFTCCLLGGRGIEVLDYWRAPLAPWAKEEIPAPAEDRQHGDDAEQTRAGALAAPRRPSITVRFIVLSVDGIRMAPRSPSIEG